MDEANGISKAETGSSSITWPSPVPCRTHHGAPYEWVCGSRFAFRQSCRQPNDWIDKGLVLKPDPEARMILGPSSRRRHLRTAQVLSLSMVAKSSVRDIYIGVLAASKRSLRTQSPLLQSQPTRVFESTTQMFSTPNFM